MKKMFIALGIAFALFCGGFAIGCNVSDCTADSNGHATPEEAMVAYLVDANPESKIEDVEVYDITCKGMDDVEYVDAFVRVDGELVGYSVPSTILAEYGF